MTCPVCAHEKRDLIAAALNPGRTPREVCRTFNLTKLVLLKHLQHAPMTFLGHPQIHPVRPGDDVTERADGE